MTAARQRVISDLRERIASLEGASARKAGCLSFGVPDVPSITKSSRGVSKAIYI
jgi:protein ImuA